MTDPVVLGPDELDFDEYARLQAESYAELLARNGVAPYLTPRYYAWKYRPLTGTARVAIVRDAGRLVAANAMFPAVVADGVDRAIAWQSCDTATHPSARGRGLFSRCIEALRASLRDENVFFGFPNASSIGGFRKLGWEVRADVDTYVRPVMFGTMRPHPGIRPTREGDDVGTLAAHVCAATGPTIMRDEAYLQWRYARHPVHRYESFVADDGAGPHGLLVVRTADVGGRRVAAVMEALAPEERTVVRLLRYARTWARERGARAAVCLATTLSAGAALRAGFVRVPRRLLPKRQVLMGAACGQAAERIWSRRWNVQLGDWDAF